MGTLKTEVEEIKLLATGDYEVVVRANLYEPETKTDKVLGARLSWTEPRKTGSVAEFTVRVARPQPRRGTPTGGRTGRDRAIGEIKRLALAAVLDLCREIAGNPANP